MSWPGLSRPPMISAFGGRRRAAIASFGLSVFMGRLDKPGDDDEKLWG